MVYSNIGSFKRTTGKGHLFALSGDLHATPIGLANIKINGRDSSSILKSHMGRSQSDHTQTSEHKKEPTLYSTVNQTQLQTKKKKG